MNFGGKTSNLGAAPHDWGFAKNVLLPLLTDLFHLLLTDGVTPHLWHKVKNHASTQERSNYIPTELSLASNQWLYLQTFCKRGQGLVDGLGSCLAEHQIPDSQFGSAPQGTPTNPSLFCDIFSLLQKRKNEGVHCFSGPPCCLRQYSKRETLETLQKLRLHNI